MGVLRDAVNLVQNAVKYANENIAIQIEEDDGVVSVVVDDDGPGIPEEEREKILQPFVRLASHKKKSGFGLGLAIVRRIMRWHKGQVLVEESALGGARFILRWPNT